mmetsp:Transcript_294/g.2359  ORF Transcript_294/g.2359 Transcript_294/m.2359 type:complete len:186 (+) Transcript_294:444-1001(+)
MDMSKDGFVRLAGIDAEKYLSMNPRDPAISTLVPDGKCASPSAIGLLKTGPFGLLLPNIKVPGDADIPTAAAANVGALVFGCCVGIFIEPEVPGFRLLVGLLPILDGPEDCLLLAGILIPGDELLPGAKMGVDLSKLPACGVFLPGGTGALLTAARPAAAAASPGGGGGKLVLAAVPRMCLAAAS